MTMSRRPKLICHLKKEVASAAAAVAGDVAIANFVPAQCVCALCVYAFAGI